MCVHLFLKSVNDSMLYTLFLQSCFNIHPHANFFYLRLYLGDGGGAETDISQGQIGEEEVHRGVEVRIRADSQDDE